MAITFDLSKIKKYEKVCLSSDSARSWTDTFIYATLTLQMGDITEENWKEWATRFLLLSPPPARYTATRKTKYKKFVVSKVYAHIGLTTNVTKFWQKTNVTWSKLYVDQQKKNMLAFIDKAHSDNENARLRRNAAARKRHAAKKAARTNNETK